MKNFQVIILIVSIIAGLFGLLVFAGYIPIGKEKVTTLTGSVVMWGTINSNAVLDAVENFSRTNPTISVKYVQKDESTFDRELLEALASGTGPDMFILPDNLIIHYKNKIMPIPYAGYPLETFRNTFASAGEIYLSEKGILALPLSIDPMVLYYNRSFFDTEGIVNPPKDWNELQEMVPKFTKKDTNNKLSQSAVALGQFTNVFHSKDILSMLFMQAGNSIVREMGGQFISALGIVEKNSVEMSQVLDFYITFANPQSTNYSWNRTLNNSRDTFSAEKSAMYFGFASEIGKLTEKNPNQDFYVAPVPQIKNSKNKITFGRTQALAVSAFTKNPSLAFNVAGLLASGDFAEKFANNLYIAPARRDLLSIKPTDAYFPIFYNSALFARAWLDPSTDDTDSIFKKMVESVLSNNQTAASAIAEASANLSLLLKR